MCCGSGAAAGQHAAYMRPVLYLKHLKQSFAPFFYQRLSAFNSLRLAQNVKNYLTLLVEAGSSVTLNMKGAVKKVKPVCFFALHDASSRSCCVVTGAANLHAAGCHQVREVF